MSIAENQLHMRYPSERLEQPNEDVIKLWTYIEYSTTDRTLRPIIQGKPGLQLGLAVNWYLATKLVVLRNERLSDS